MYANHSCYLGSFVTDFQQRINLVSEFLGNL